MFFQNTDLLFNDLTATYSNIDTRSHELESLEQKHFQIICVKMLEEFVSCRMRGRGLRKGSLEATLARQARSAGY